MFTCNTNIEDRVVNGSVGKALRIWHERNEAKVIYVKYDEKNAGPATMQSAIIDTYSEMWSIFSN